MYEVVLINNKNGKKFKKEFNSEYLLNIFLNKVKYSKKLTLVSYTKTF